jgi:hypothetical protein
LVSEERNNVVTGKIQVDTADMWPLLINSVRYAIGRASYAPAEVADLVRKYGAALKSWQRQQIAQEIGEEIRFGKRIAARSDSNAKFPYEGLWTALADELEKGAKP